jgi:uncharacterized protein (DUF1697 family)
MRQRGNLVFRADDEPRALEGNLEKLFPDTLGLKTEVRAPGRQCRRQSLP